MAPRNVVCYDVLADLDQLPALLDKVMQDAPSKPPLPPAWVKENRRLGRDWRLERLTRRWAVACTACVAAYLLLGVGLALRGLG